MEDQHIVHFPYEPRVEDVYTSLKSFYDGKQFTYEIALFFSSLTELISFWLDSYIKQYSALQKFQTSSTRSELFEDILNGRYPIRSTYEEILKTQIFISVIASFEVYLKDLIRHMLSQNRHSLISSKTLSFEEILKCQGRLEDLMIEKFLKDEFSGAYTDWMSQMERKYSVPTETALFTADELKIMSYWFECRHLIMHNGGKVDQKFIDKISTNPLVDITQLEIAMKISFSNRNLASLFNGVVNQSIRLEKYMFENKTMLDYRDSGKSHMDLFFKGMQSVALDWE